jgi:hypothetical protein
VAFLNADLDFEGIDTLDFLRSLSTHQLGLLGQQSSVNVGQDTTLSNGNVSEQLVQLFIVSNGQLQVTRNDTSLLVVTSSVSSQFENFSHEVFQDGSEVNGSTGTNTLSVVSLAEQSVDTTDRELQTGLA